MNPPEIAWYASRLPGREVGFAVAHHLQDVVLVGEQVQVEGLARQVGHAGPVRQDVADGDPALAVGGVLGDVLGHRVVDVDRPRSSRTWTTIAVIAFEAE